MRSNKYGAQKKTVDNIVFDSKMEAERYNYLKLLQRGGVISDLIIQPEFVLVEPFKKKGKKKRGIKYTADFMYTNEFGTRVVEDVKGATARDFSLRKTLFDSKFPDIDLLVVKKDRGAWVTK